MTENKKITCPCGSNILKVNLPAYSKTKKHRKFLGEEVVEKEKKTENMVAYKNNYMKKYIKKRYAEDPIYKQKVIASNKNYKSRQMFYKKIDNVLKNKASIARINTKNKYIYDSRSVIQNIKGIIRFFD